MNDHARLPVSAILAALAAFVLLAFPPMPAPVEARDASRDRTKADKLFAERKYSEAIELYQQVLADDPDSSSAGPVHAKIADSYFQLADFYSAREAYLRALKVQARAERPMTQYWVGFCAFLIGRDEEAIAEFLKIPELYADSGMLVSTAYYWAGRASERMGKKEQAAAYYKKAGGNGKSTPGRHAMKRAEAVKE